MRLKRIGLLAGSILICQLAGIIGSVFTISSIDSWYATLEKPFFNPPSWVFGPVWTILYIMMGISLFLVLEKTGKRRPYRLFGSQLFLNFLWSVAFFGLESPWAGFAVIVPLWAMIALTAVEFRKYSKGAFYLLLPYLLWVSFAAVLNLSIALLN